MSSRACLAANRCQLVLSQRREFFPSLILFSTSPRPLYTLTTVEPASPEFVMINPIRGNNSPKPSPSVAPTSGRLVWRFSWKCALKEVAIPGGRHASEAKSGLLSEAEEASGRLTASTTHLLKGGHSPGIDHQEEKVIILSWRADGLSARPRLARERRRTLVWLCVQGYGVLLRPTADHPFDRNTRR
jgi:hypothetical protein